jgi:hypothetical protein
LPSRSGPTIASAFSHAWPRTRTICIFSRRRPTTRAWCGRRSSRIPSWCSRIGPTRLRESVRCPLRESPPRRCSCASRVPARARA